MSAITPLMRRVRVSSDLRDTKRADLQPARQVKRAPLTKEQEGKHGNTHGDQSPPGDLRILNQSQGEHTTTTIIITSMSRQWFLDHFHSFCDKNISQ